MIFKGVCTALVTPFKKDKSIDFLALEKLIKNQLEAKVGAILILGTTGESATIDYYERAEIIRFARKLIKKPTKFIVGTGANDTNLAIKNCSQAKMLGADAVLCVTPFYNKSTQNGLVEYYKKIDSQNIPFLVYNVPSRTGVNVLPDTYTKLVTLKNFAGIKEANGNIEHILEVFDKLDSKKIYCGNDNLSLIFHMLGASGVISVTSNAYPKEVAYAWKNVNTHKKYAKKFYQINKDLFVEPNPIPIKYLLSRQGLIKNALREPLTEIEESNKKLLNGDIKIL